MDLYAILDQVVDLLHQRQRVTYRALKRQFNLDDNYLERVAQLSLRDRNGSCPYNTSSGRFVG